MSQGDFDDDELSDRVGSFTLVFADRKFRWSPEVAAMHGYPPEPMTLPVDEVLAHKHPDDRDRVAALVEELIDNRTPLSSRHRIIDRAGQQHDVLVVSTTFVDDAGTVVGVDGFYVDISSVLDARLDSAVADFTVHRAAIEQAKGMLMLAYGISGDRAFDVLRWRSQHTNTKVRTLCERLVARATIDFALSDANRSRFDHLLLTISPEPTDTLGT